MPRRTLQLLIATLVVGGSSALAGCSASVGSSDTLNTGKAESLIAKGLTAQLGGKVTVSCPKDVKVKKGGTFDCEATSPGGEKAKVAVVQKDDKGNISYSIN